MDAALELAHVDTETRSTCDLKRGVYRYAQDPSTEVLCFSWRIGDGETYEWNPGDPDPQRLLDHIASGRPVKAHNMSFDRIIWNGVLRRALPHWPIIKTTQVMCSMAQAQAMALPAALDKLGEVLGVDVTKDKAGKALMLRMCKPRKVTDAGEIIWWDTPEMRRDLSSYCAQDTRAECAVDTKLFPLPPAELSLYRLDQEINDRGVRIDVPFVTRAWAVVEEATRRANIRIWKLTGGAVSRVTEAAKIVAWLQSRGIPCESVAKDEIDDMVLTAGLLGDEDAAEALQLRVASGSASVKKLIAALNSVCEDGRLRGMIQYHAATTGRFAGRIVQPHNLKRVPEDFDVEFALSIVMSDAPPAKIVDALELIFGNPLDVLSVMLRAMFIAEPGSKFVGGDLSNIEGRVNAWLSGETALLQAFRDYDAGVGPDLYKITAAGILGKTVDQITKTERQSYGKVPTLACGYGGSVGAFQTMGVNYGVVMEDEQAQSIVDGWRASNPNIVQGWWDAQDAAIDAVAHPGLKVPCYGGKVTYLCANGFLFCMIPSGRVLCYALPKLVKQTITTRKGNEIERTAVKYWKAKGRAWVPQILYGGLQCENIVQALARDVLVHGMRGAEAAGYSVVLHVHDELLCEVPDDPRFSPSGLESIMADLPVWATGLPLAAAAWEGERYEK